MEIGKHYKLPCPHPQGAGLSAYQWLSRSSGILHFIRSSQKPYSKSRFKEKFYGWDFSNRNKPWKNPPRHCPNGAAQTHSQKHLLKTSSTDTLLRDMVGNYNIFFFNKHCPSRSRKILKDICTQNSPTKYVLSYKNDKLNQTGIFRVSDESKG